MVELLSEPSQAKVAASKAKKPPAGVSGDLLKVIRRAIEEVGSTNVNSLAVPNNVPAVRRMILKDTATQWLGRIRRRSRTRFARCFRTT